MATAARVLLNEMVYKIYETNKYQSPCYSANISGVMYPEGQVYPCEILEDRMIGNLRDHNMNFMELWNSPKNKDTKDFIIKSGI